MVRAVEDGGLEVAHRVAGWEAAHAGILDALSHGRHELPWNRAPEDVVLELEIAAARKRFDPDLAVAELPVATGLFLMTAVRLGRRRDRFAGRDPWRGQGDFNTPAALHVSARGA